MGLDTGRRGAKILKLKMNFIFKIVETSGETEC